MQPLEDWLPVWVMENEGFAQQQGLKIVEETSIGGTAGNELVATGLADVGYGAPVLDLLLVPGGLIPNKEVALPDATHIGTTANPESVIVGNSSIKSLKDLEGHTLATHTPASLFFLAAKYILQKQGIDMNKIHVVQVPIPEMEAALKAGRTDAFISGMDVAYKTQADGVGHTIAPVIGNQLLDNFAVDFTLVNAGFYKSNPDAVLRYLTAEMKSVQWIVAHADEARALRNKKLGYAQDSPVNNVPLLTWVPGGYFTDPHQIDIANQMLLSAGLIKSAIDSSTIMTGEDTLAKARQRVGLPATAPKTK